MRRKFFCLDFSAQIIRLDLWIDAFFRRFGGIFALCARSDRTFFDRIDDSARATDWAFSARRCRTCHPHHCLKGAARSAPATRCWTGSSSVDFGVSSLWTVVSVACARLCEADRTSWTAKIAPQTFAAGARRTRPFSTCVSHDQSSISFRKRFRHRSNRNAPSLSTLPNRSSYRKFAIRMASCMARNAEGTREMDASTSNAVHFAHADVRISELSHAEPEHHAVIPIVVTASARTQNNGKVARLQTSCLTARGQTLSSNPSARF